MRHRSFRFQGAKDPDRTHSPTSRESMADDHSKRRRFQRGSLLAGLCVLPLSFLWMFRTDSDPSVLSATTVVSKPKIDWSIYENCTLPTVTFDQHAWDARETKSKPLFAPSFPTALDDGVLRNMVNYMTGAPATVKSFYAQSRKQGLRKCYGPTQTVLCTLVHPLVQTEPSKFTDRFHSAVVMPLRNPATNIPSYLQMKAEKYHHQVGQMPISAWRNMRDDGYQSYMNQYINQIKTWQQQETDYHVALYISYEDLMEPDTGRAIVQKLAQLLQTSGYQEMMLTNLSDQEATCIWYHSVGPTRLKAHAVTGYAEYNDYTPSYTTEQYMYMIQELQDFLSTVKDDRALTDILQSYIADMQRVKQFDIQAPPKESNNNAEG